MAIDPVTFGVVSGGLNFLSGIANYQAQRQDYVNKLAYKKASDEFASWSARQQAAQTDINNQYKFWGEKVNYGQSLAYTNSLRNYDFDHQDWQSLLISVNILSALVQKNQVSFYF